MQALSIVAAPPEASPYLKRLVIKGGANSPSEPFYNVWKKHKIRPRRFPMLGKLRIVLYTAPVQTPPPNT